MGTTVPRTSVAAAAPISIVARGIAAVAVGAAVPRTGVAADAQMAVVAGGFATIAVDASVGPLDGECERGYRIAVRHLWPRGYGLRAYGLSTHFAGRLDPF